MKKLKREVIYLPDENGFLKQQDIHPFDYSVEYKKAQSTDARMSWLRMGWLSANIPYDDLKTFNVVDLGSGNGVFIKESSKVFKRIVPFDLAGESITKEELYSTVWDLVVASDVIEHFNEIDDFWKIRFRYAFISFPEVPKRLSLKLWHHYKPDEHIYALSLANVVKWAEKHGMELVACGVPEDMLRTRWDEKEPNISTVLIKTKKSSWVV
jgi:SAM-dependent methyltransferase